MSKTTVCKACHEILYFYHKINIYLIFIMYDDSKHS
jgi:hypothetical protein